MNKLPRSLAKVVLDNCTALDYILGEQGSVCMTINSSCCAYINISSQVEISASKICQQATWQQTLDHHTPVLEEMSEGITDSSALFLRIPNEIKSVLEGILKLGLAIFLIVLLICLIKIIAH